MRPRRRYAPDRRTNFERATAGFTTTLDHVFGTAPAPAGATRIATYDELMALYRPYQNGTWMTVINTEMERFTTDPANFPFASDALELTATMATPTGTQAPQAVTVAADVAYSRTVTLTSMPAMARGGRVIGLQAKARANLHASYSCALRGTIVTGDTVTLTFASVLNDRFASIAITVTAVGGDTFAAIAQRMVDAINADATLAAERVQAFKYPTNPGTFFVTVPKRARAGSPSLGRLANGSLRAITVVASKTGTVTFSVAQSLSNIHVVSVSGNTLTLSHPVDLAAGDVLVINPALMLLRTDTYSAAAALQPVGATTGIEQYQLIQSSFQNNNPLRLTAVGATDVTVEASLGLVDGVFMTILPAYALLTSAATTASKVLTFASVPAGVEVGMQYRAADLGAPNVSIVVEAVDRTTPGAHTVTVSTPVTVGSGGRIQFWPAIKSAQIWSKDIIQPEGDHPIVAMELVCEVPHAVDLGAWPAFWLYTDTDDPNPGQTVQAASEIDMFEGYVYWNNSTGGGYRAAVATGSPVDVYNYPDMSSGNLPGNNMGDGERKLQLIWTASKVQFFLDGVLIREQAFAWNTYKRAQTGINLAVGSLSTSFHPNGLFPIDMGRLPMAYRIKRRRVLVSN